MDNLKLISISKLNVLEYFYSRTSSLIVKCAEARRQEDPSKPSHIWRGQEPARKPQCVLCRLETRPEDPVCQIAGRRKTRLTAPCRGKATEPRPCSSPETQSIVEEGASNDSRKKQRWQESDPGSYLPHPLQEGGRARGGASARWMIWGSPASGATP